MRRLLWGLGSGYAAIVLQGVSSLILIPFLVSQEGLGLAGYGSLASLLAISGFFSMSMDGWRLSIAQRLGAAEEASRSQLFLSNLVVVVALVGASTAMLWVYQAPLIRWVGLDEVQGIGVALWLAMALFGLEQVAYQCEVVLHRTGRSWLANSAVALEVTLRVVVVITAMKTVEASLLVYLAAFVGLFSLRVCALAGLLLGTHSVALESPPIAMVRREFAALRSAAVLSLQGGATYVVYRLTVVLANRLSGPEVAGVLAVLLGTLRGYVLQLVFSAARPMLIPLGAGHDLRVLDTALKTRLEGGLALYQLAVSILGLIAVGTAPVWLTAWLGARWEDYALPAGLLAGAYIAELLYLPVAYLLVSQARAVTLSLFGGVLAMAYIGSAWIIGAAGHGVSGYAVAVVCFIAIFGIGVLRQSMVWLGLDTPRLSRGVVLYAMTALPVALIAAHGWSTLPTATVMIIGIGVGILFTLAHGRLVMPVLTALRSVVQRTV